MFRAVRGGIDCRACLWGAPDLGETSDLANGVLGVGGMVGGESRLFINPLNRGFDVEVRFSGDFRGGYAGPQPVLGGDNYIWFESGWSDAQHFAWVEMFFYRTGTQDPVDVLGFKTNIEDVERGGEAREWLIGPKIVSNGEAENLEFADSSIFSFPAGSYDAIFDHKNVNGEWLSRAVPGFGVENGTQAGKTVTVDLSTIPLSYFRIGESRYKTNAGSVLMGPIGDIRMVPAPGAAVLGAIGLGLLGWTRKRLA